MLWALVAAFVVPVRGDTSLGTTCSPYLSPDLCALPNLPTFNVKDYGALGDGATDDTVAIRATINAASSAGGGIVYFPTGTYAVCNQGDDPVPTLSKPLVPIFHIYTSNLVFMGDGPTLSRLKGYMPGLSDPLTNWYVLSTTDYFKIARFGMFYVDASQQPISNIQFRSLQIDGNAGWTGNYKVGGVPSTGDGWDLTHKAIRLGGSASASGTAHNLIDHLVILDCDITRWRGEIAYGYNVSGSIYILNSNLHSSNADAVSSSGDVVIANTTLGGPYPGDDVYHGVENFGYDDQQTVVQDCVVSASSNGTSRHGMGLVFIGHSNARWSVLRNVVTRNTYGIMFSDRVNNASIQDNAFNDNDQALITSPQNLYPQEFTPGMSDCVIASNTYDHSGSIIVVQNGDLGFPYLSIHDNTVTNGSILGGGYGSVPNPSGWAGFAVSGNRLGTGGKDVSSIKGCNVALWSSTVRPTGTSSAGYQVDDFVVENRKTITPKSDLTWLNGNQSTEAMYAVIDPTLLQAYPAGYVTSFILGAKQNWVLPADPAWNTFTSDVPVSNGLAIYMGSNGLFNLQSPTPTPTPTPTVQVTVQTSVPGLSFTVDSTPYTAAQTFSWTPGSSHTIATTSPQSGATGVQYVWSNWSGGGTISHSVAPTTNKTYTANFTTQYYLTMGAGSGGTVTPSSGWKNSGASVSITATPTNNSSVSYTFSGWTGSGTVSYSGTNNPASITMNGPITETAAFTQNPVQVTVQTSVAGLSFTVDGTAYTAAQTFSWAPGSSHIIATTSPQSGATGVRYVWSGWTGGGTISHSVAPTTNKTYTATFATQYFLTMNAGVGGTVSPSSGWRKSGATLSISATPATGHTFGSWTGSGTGSYSGTNNPASITMSGPITETAAFTP